MERRALISRPVYSAALRTLALGASCGILLGAAAWQGPVTEVAPVFVTTYALDDRSVITATTEVTRIDNNGSCEYRLEYMAPGDKTRGINEIGGNRGAAQRINSCTALPPAFAATTASNAAWLDEQSAYYWAKKSRDYAEAALWITPPGWQDGPFTLGNAEVSLSVLTVGDWASGFRLACSPRGQEADGCMRYWPGQNPKIYIPAGRAVPSVIVHEYGHYAAGYVFGHMDSLGSGGFKIDNCVHRAFQEGVAETFKQLFLHHELTSAGIATPLGNIAGRNTQWSNDCGPGEYRMSDPLWEAFAQSVWGTGTDPARSPITVPWPSAASANTGMANAFTFALLKIRDFRMHDFALAALDHVDKNQAPAIATAIRAIFASHGLTLAANGKQCIENRECLSGYCDNGEGTSRTRLCMPAARTGLDTDPCTDHNQCASNLCFGLTRNAAGDWVPGRCVAPRALGATCIANDQCGSTYCDTGLNTANTNKCMPRGGTGQDGDLCTHDRQCASNGCAGLTRNGAGDWVPGHCVAQGALGASCSTNAQCRSTYCDAGFNTANTNKCMPRGGTGQGGDPCTHNSQCASSRCDGLTQVGGAWQPGRCQ